MGRMNLTELRWIVKDLSAAGERFLDLPSRIKNKAIQ